MIGLSREVWIISRLTLESGCNETGRISKWAAGHIGGTGGETRLGAMRNPVLPGGAVPTGLSKFCVKGAVLLWREQTNKAILESENNLKKLRIRKKKKKHRRVLTAFLSTCEPIPASEILTYWIIGGTNFPLSPRCAPTPAIPAELCMLEAYACLLHFCQSPSTAPLSLLAPKKDENRKLFLALELGSMSVSSRNNLEPPYPRCRARLQRNVMMNPRIVSVGTPARAAMRAQRIVGAMLALAMGMEEVEGM